MLKLKKSKTQKGITLIALIITIVVLLILAVVAISAIQNDGILSYAQNAAKDYNQAAKNEQDMLQGYLNFLENGGSGNDNEDEPTEGEGSGTGDGSGTGSGGTTQTVATAKNTVLSTTSNTDVYDEYGNKIVVPAGFKIRVDDTTNNADTVTEGIVIEHGTDGNQFVWIPVGKIYTDTSKTEANAKTVTLGRYSWSGSTGTLIQPTEDNLYTSNIELTMNSYKFKEYQPTNTTKNIKARNINDFYESATTKCGYYIGRYEAGDSSNTEVANRTGTAGETTEGTLVCKANQVPYNWITQPDAASKCQSMYTDGYSSGTFSSDLMNSYAWDTAIIFIQTFGIKSNSSTYASTISESTMGTSAPQKTGENILSATGQVDEQLNIYDMAGNCSEATTETSTSSSYPIVHRGGNYLYKSKSTSVRNVGSNGSMPRDAFRPILYVGL